MSGNATVVAAGTSAVRKKKTKMQATVDVPSRPDLYVRPVTAIPGVQDATDLKSIQVYFKEQLQLLSKSKGGGSYKESTNKDNAKCLTVIYETFGLNLLESNWLSDLLWKDQKFNYPVARGFREVLQAYNFDPAKLIGITEIIETEKSNLGKSLSGQKLKELFGVHGVEIQSPEPEQPMNEVAQPADTNEPLQNSSMSTSYGHSDVLQEVAFSNATETQRERYDRHLQYALAQQTWLIQAQRDAESQLLIDPRLRDQYAAIPNDRQQGRYEQSSFVDELEPDTARKRSRDDEDHNQDDEDEAAGPSKRMRQWL